LSSYFKKYIQFKLNNKIKVLSLSVILHRLSKKIFSIVKYHHQNLILKSLSISHIPH